MKKILYIFFMIIMLGCGKEPEQKEVITEKNYKVSEITAEGKESLEKKKEKDFSFVEIKTYLSGKPRIEIGFNEDIKEENIDAYVNISPEVSYNVLTDKNKIIINGYFKAGKL